MVELFVKLTNKWHSVDLGEDLPALNFESNDLGKLEDKRVSYSQSLKLPNSANNNIIFGYASNPLALSVAPYREYKCMLLVDGYNMLGGEARLVIVSAGSNYEVQILGREIEAIQKLKLAKLKRDQSIAGEYIELDIGKIDLASSHDMGSMNDYKRPLRCFALQADRPDVNGKMDRLQINESMNDINKLQPYVLLSEIRDALSRSLDITLKDDFSTEIADRWAFAVSGVIQTPEPIIYTKNNSIKPVEVKKENVNNVSRNLYVFRADSLDYNSVINLRKDKDNAGYASVYSPEIILDGRSNRGIYKLVISTNRSDVKMILKNHDSSDNKVKYTETDLYAGDNLIDVTSYYESGGDNIAAPSILFAVPNISTPVSLEFTVIAFESLGSDDGINGIIKAQDNLGFDTALDLVMELAKSTGRFIRATDTEVELYSPSLVAFTPATNWSDRFTDKNLKRKFSIGGYARKNIIPMEPDKLLKVEDSIIFGVENEQLAKEKQLFKSKLQSGLNMSFDMNIYTSVESALVPSNDPVLKNIEIGAMSRYEYSYIGLWNWKYKYVGTGKPMLLNISKNHFTRYEHWFYDLHTVDLVVPIANVVVGSDLSNLYSNLTKVMLSPAIVFEANINLRAVDIVNFDNKYPVLIEQLGGYFYVNKINNFVPGELTSVELIKLSR